MTEFNQQRQQREGQFLKNKKNRKKYFQFRNSGVILWIFRSIRCQNRESRIFIMFICKWISGASNFEIELCAMVFVRSTRESATLNCEMSANICYKLLGKCFVTPLLFLMNLKRFAHDISVGIRECGCGLYIGSYVRTVCKWHADGTKTKQMRCSKDSTWTKKPAAFEMHKFIS